MKTKNIIYTFLLTIATLTASAQAIDYTGIWNGKFYDNSSFGSADETYRFEVQIAQTGKAIQGVTYSYQNTRFYGKAAQNGYVKTDGKKIVVQETKMIELKMDIGVACLMTCTMKYSKIGDDEYLEGTYTAAEEKTGSNCQGGYVKLKKIKKSIFGTTPMVQKRLAQIEKAKIAAKPKPIVPKPSLPKSTNATTKPTIPKNTTASTNTTNNKPKDVVTNTTKPTNTPTIIKKDTIIKNTTTVTVPAVTKPVEIKPIPVVPTILQQRKTELVQSIVVTDTNVLVIDFYDYGEVDGDIVTIFVNNKEVITKQMLGTKPIQVPIKLDATTPEIEVIMYADNLGSTPPNTAYMTVRINGKKYDATIESTEQKNASVKFIFKPLLK